MGQDITTGSNRGAVTESQSTRRSISSRVDDIHDLTPVDRAEFGAEIAPILALVAPTGMQGAERTAWLTAAYRALDGVPIGLLRRGVTEAMKTVDHPSKIVAAIYREIEKPWHWRRANRPTEQRQERLPAPIETDDERADREEVAKLMANLRKSMEAKL